MQKTSLKPFRRWTFWVALIFVFTSCSSSSNARARITDPTTPPSTSSTFSTNQPETNTTQSGELTLQTGVLVACTAVSKPFTFENDEGDLVGFDVDLLKEIARRNNVELQLQIFEFEEIWLRPQLGDCDIVAASMTITEERQKVAAFTAPYFATNQSLAIRDQDIGTITSLDDLKGKSIGVLSGSTGLAFAQSSTREAAIKQYSEPAEIYDALESSEIDAVLIDEPLNAEQEENRPFETVAIFFTEEEYGMSTSPDNQQLRDVVSDNIDQIRTDGTYDEIYGRWL